MSENDDAPIPMLVAMDDSSSASTRGKRRRAPRPSVDATPSALLCIRCAA